MRNLLKFLKRFRNFAVFFFLQLIVLSAFFNSKNFHKATFVNSSSSLSGWFIEKRYDLNKHFNLDRDIDSISNKYAQLLTQANSALYQHDSATIKIIDSVHTQQYEYLNAFAINHTINKLNNYLTINKGLKSGISIGMGIINEDGIIGFIIDASDHYAIVRTILAEKINISVEINDINGRLVWNGKDHRVGQIKGITSSAKVFVGDTVYTRGSNGHFPRKMVVGIVEEVEVENGSATLTIPVKIGVNFDELGAVLVVKNLFIDEQNIIEGTYYEE